MVMEFLSKMRKIDYLNRCQAKNCLNVLHKREWEMLSLTLFCFFVPFFFSFSPSVFKEGGNILVTLHARSNVTSYHILAVNLYRNI